MALSKMGCKDKLINKFLRTVDKSDLTATVLFLDASVLADHDNMVSFEEFKSGYSMIIDALVSARKHDRAEKKKRRASATQREKAGG